MKYIWILVLLCNTKTISVPITDTVSMSKPKEDEIDGSESTDLSIH